MEQVLPKYCKVFKDTNSNTSLIFLSKCPSIYDFYRGRVSTFIWFDKSHSQGRHELDYAERLKLLLNETIGVDNGSLSFSIKQTIEKLNLLINHISDIENLLSIM